MAETPSGTSVGVEDPYAHVDRCDHCTDEGRCRFAVEHGERDPEFANARSREAFRCPVVHEVSDASETRARSTTRERDDLTEEGLTGPWEWADCPQFRSRNHDRECVRCGLEEHRLAHDDERPLLEEHHLSYRSEGDEGDRPSHEVTVYLCRWCHAKVHDSWARVDDDADPDPEAVAAREARRGRELAETAFETAANRRDGDTRD